MRHGALLLDTPGMRELQLADCEDGVSATFADITELVTRCRFTDCEHRSEPGCAVQAAILEGDLAPRRLDNYLKLMREQQLNAATLAEKRASGRALTKFYRAVQSSSQQRKKGE
jgi:ribosome biogenesis GTPase